MSTVDKIYEAAFLPELWPEVLGQIAERSGASSGALLIIDKRLPPLFSATPNIVDTLTEFARNPVWYTNRPAHRLQAMKYPGFIERARFFNEDELNPETPYSENMEKIGADWQVGSIVDMPAGELALFTFERQSGLPDFSAHDLKQLDLLRPHLARASMMASRLKLERAEANVAALDAVGVPACVVTQSGSALAANALFERLGDVLRPGAFGRIVATNNGTDQLLQAALPAVGRTLPPEVRSFPTRLEENDTAIVIHVIPLHRAASDIFGSGAALVAVTGYSVDGNLPSDAVLRGLFDLSVAEAGIATGLSAGLSVKDIASQRGISMTTARTQLSQIFRKTGTNQQGQLIALLKGISGYART